MVDEEIKSNRIHETETEFSVFQLNQCTRSLGGSGPLTHVSVYSTQFYFQVSNYSGTS
jgi:hypothetical protein